MIVRIRRFFRTFFVFVVVFCLLRMGFLVFNRALFPSLSGADVLGVLTHGLPLDFSMAGYLTLLPALLLLASVWTQRPWLRRTLLVYLGVAALLIASAFALNIVLYPYWGFPLDSTPLFYFFSSPADAFASATPLQLIFGPIGVLLLAAALFWLLRRLLASGSLPPVGRRVATAAALLVLTAALFLPIRGGITVSTMNVGRAYFSENMRLNHAAVNPLFSLMASLAKETDFSEQYRFMPDEEAKKIFETLCDTAQISDGTAETLIRKDIEKPNVIFIVLESFSSALMESLGGEKGVVPHLERLADEGLLFTHFFANSFRTDRGLTSILSAYPAQPTTSIMKYPRKSQSLPSLARSLRDAGYGAYYYYGGDADFTNMRSYLVASGFERIVADKDFPLTERTGKWGAPDGPLCDRFLADLRTAGALPEPFFGVLQTSSSHEPFDVPYSRLQNPRLNAFAYTDSCIGTLFAEMKQLPLWDRTLIVCVPDHLGCFPEDISNFTLQRFRIPLILAGGALERRGRCDVVGSQIDIAATLLDALGLPRSQFRFSKNLLAPAAPHFAFFSFPDAFGFVDADENAVIFDNESGRAALTQGQNADSLTLLGKAFLQTLYDDLSKR